MSLYPELDGRSLDGLTALFDGPPLDGEEGAVAFYQDVADRIGAAGGAALLWSRTTIGDVPRLRGLVLALSRYDRTSDRIRPWLLSLLDGNPDVVAEAIDGLARLDDSAPAERVLSLGAHASEYVRGAVLRYACRIVPSQAWSLLERAAVDPHFIVRENVADELAELNDSRAQPLLERLASDPHPHVAEAARSALEQLRGRLS